MPSSPIIFQNAEKFEDSYTRHFQNDGEGDEDGVLHKLKRIFKQLTKRKVVYVFLGIFIIITLILYRLKPSLLTVKKFNYQSGKYVRDVDYQSLLLYSLLLSFISILLVVYLNDKHNFLSKILGKESGEEYL